MQKRVIGRFEGSEKGPLLIVFGGIHGNEPAGIKALDLMFKMLEVEPITNPRFQYKGTLLGLVGNLQAFQKNERFISRDLNRSWTEDRVNKVKSQAIENLKNEDLEIREILDLIEAEIERTKPEKLIVLDLHTTSSFGGIFTIPTENPESLKIALELHAPVITGMLKKINGTILHYFNTQNIGIETVAVAFESGQHTEELSVNRAIAAITNCMRSIGSVSAEDVENRHDSILIEYSKSLPKVASLVERHEVVSSDHFKMFPNYRNFQKVKKGEVIASDKNGEIRASKDAIILMPLYQKQGEDGFFLVTEVEGY